METNLESVNTADSCRTEPHQNIGETIFKGDTAKMGQFPSLKLFQQIKGAHASFINCF